MRVRTATTADLAVAAALERESMGADAWDEATLAGELVGERVTRCAVVADADGEVVGYAVLLTSGDTADVLRVVVAAAHRRRGVGRLLLTALVSQAAGRGCAQLLLEVADDNAPARAFYAAAGFELISRRDSYHSGGRDARVLRLGLGAPSVTRPGPLP